MTGKPPGPAEFALSLLLLGTAWFLVSSEGHPWLAFALLFGALILAEQDAKQAGIAGPLAEARTALQTGTLTGPVVKSLPGPKA